MSRVFRRSLAVSALAGCCILVPLAGCEGTPKADRPPPRAGARAGTPITGVFVTRWDFRSPTDVDRVVEQASASGFTDLFWQVRGEGDAYYASDIEPRAIPGFDPLARAIESARARGMRVHAWFNTLTLAHRDTPPPEEPHIAAAHPEWIFADASGAPVRSADGYAMLNPALPQVHDHLAAVVRELCGAYALDGVCFDYLRLPRRGDAGTPMPMDEATADLYRAERELGETRSFDDWVRHRTEELRDRLVASARSARAGIATFVVTPPASEPGGGDGVVWVPVIAAADAAEFSASAARWTSMANERVLVAFAPLASSAPEETARALATLGPRRNRAVFTIASIAETVDLRVPSDPLSVALRAARAAEVRKVLAPGAARVTRATSLDPLHEQRGVPTPEAERNARAAATEESAAAEDPAPPTSVEPTPVDATSDEGPSPEPSEADGGEPR